MNSQKTYGGTCANSHVKFKASASAPPATKVKSTSKPKWAPSQTAKAK